MTANSSSGSKYYDITPGPFDFAAVQNQEYTPNFTNVEVSGDAIAMTTYRSADMTVVDRVTLQKPADPTDPAPTDGRPTDRPTTPAPTDGPDRADRPAPSRPTPARRPTRPPSPRTSRRSPKATHTLRVDAVDEEAGTVTVTVPRELAGAPLDWFVHSDAEYLGDDPTDDDGVLTLQLPVDLAAGEHTLVGQRADGSVATWGTFAFVVDPAPGHPPASRRGRSRSPAPTSCRSRRAAPWRWQPDWGSPWLAAAAPDAAPDGRRGAGPTRTAPPVRPRPARADRPVRSPRSRPLRRDRETVGGTSSGPRCSGAPRRVARVSAG